LIIWDFDLKGIIKIKNIIKAFNYLNLNEDVSIACAYAYYQLPFGKLYFDTYAHKEKRDRFLNSKLLNDIIIRTKGLFWDKEIKEVKNCFSGFSIYSLSYLQHKPLYELTTEDGKLECEHISFINSIAGKKVILPFLKYRLLKNK